MRQRSRVGWLDVAWPAVDEDVVARSSEEKVEAGAADEHVVTVSARDDVVSRSADDDVVAVFRGDERIETEDLGQRDGVVQITPDDRERRESREVTGGG
jgi:cytoskeletal protein RodZ